MSKWMKFTANFDYRWASGAVTAFREGMIVNVKDEVADEAARLKAAKPADKPKAGDEGYETSGAKQETDRARREPQTVITGGHVRPARLRDVQLPDPASPDALRSEPLVVTPRLGAALAAAEAEDGVDIIETENIVVETTIPPVAGSPVAL